MFLKYDILTQSLVPVCCQFGIFVQFVGQVSCLYPFGLETVVIPCIIQSVGQISYLIISGVKQSPRLQIWLLAKCIFIRESYYTPFIHLFELSRPLQYTICSAERGGLVVGYILYLGCHCEYHFDHHLSFECHADFIYYNILSLQSLFSINHHYSIA